MFNPDFWEVSVDPQTLEALLAAPDPTENLLLTEADRAEIARKERAREQAVALIRQLIATRLTPRQREIMELHFGQGLGQEEIATRLGISQQVVSKHIYGVLREGKRVGGAVKKLQKLCAELGLDPEKWV